ncbi:MAG: hypothetical protein CVT60_06290 [Actinobacteria bacterium HGW-Actinobacteria-10]|jgi:Fic family protein|nr:MAG: hypothetical protein CVT60_06290 [Actinobacteria bacterium HGW-Actinobacteria-10]
MTYEPCFTVSSQLLGLVEEIAGLRQRIQDATIDLAWIPALQKDTRTRNAHASTAIEGNSLTLPEVRALADSAGEPRNIPRSRQEVVNYFAGLRYVEQHCGEVPIVHTHVLDLHRILSARVMDQGDEGVYRSIRVQVGRHRPPAPGEIQELMTALLGWWNGSANDLSPVLSSAIVHYRFEAIHPFADGNGRTGRALALWELYRRGFDTHHIFAVDEYFWEDRPSYYEALEQVREAGEDLSQWLEYCARGLLLTLERAWDRIQAASVGGAERIVLRPRQEQLLAILAAQGSAAPSEIWQALGVSRQGAMDLINPLIAAGLIEKVGTKKSGRYRLRRP